MVDSKVQRNIAAQPAYRERIKDTNNLFQMLLRDMQTGMHAILVVLTLRMDTPACPALRICVRQRITYILTVRMHSSISIWVIRAPPGTDTRRSFPACDG